MRRLLAYAIDSVFALVVFGLFAAIGALAPGFAPLANPAVGYPLAYLAVAGLFASLKGGVSPGLFVVGRRVVCDDMRTPNIYQLALRAGVLVLLYPSVFFVLDFVLSYLLHEEALGWNITGWFALSLCVVLFLPVFLRSRGEQGLHDVVAGTFVCDEVVKSERSTNYRYAIGSLIVALIAVVILALSVRIYVPQVGSAIGGSEAAEGMRNREVAIQAFMLDSEDLLEGAGDNVRHYAGSHGFHGFVSLSEFEAELERRGLISLSNRDIPVPVYSIEISEEAHLSSVFHDIVAKNLIESLNGLGYGMCAIEFVSRAEVPGLFMMRIVRRFLVLSVGQSGSTSPVLMLLPQNLIFQLHSGPLPEEIIRMIGGKNVQ